MLSLRSTHYWLWFLLFGIIAGFAKGFNPETVVVSLTGLGGLLVGMPAFARFARMYDLIIGLLFSALGVLGIVTSLGIAHNLGISASSDILGLQLKTPYSLIHTLLGLTSLNHGFKAIPAPTTVAVATPREATVS